LNANVATSQSVLCSFDFASLTIKKQYLSGLSHWREFMCHCCHRNTGEGAYKMGIIHDQFVSLFDAREVVMSPCSGHLPSPRLWISGTVCVVLEKAIILQLTSSKKRKKEKKKTIIFFMESDPEEGNIDIVFYWP